VDLVMEHVDAEEDHEDAQHHKHDHRDDPPGPSRTSWRCRPNQ
jgi:hypothetical protein